MAYTAWNVVFGEQPTAAKWNQLGENDAGFRDGTNIDDDAIIERHLAAGVALDNLGDTGWVTVDGTGNYSSTAIYVRRIGETVYMDGILTRNSGNITSGDVVTTLPSQYRPDQTIVLLCVGTGTTIHKISVLSNGNIQVGASSANSNHFVLDSISYSLQNP